jgi:hypothetical protein
MEIKAMKNKTHTHTNTQINHRAINNIQIEKNKPIISNNHELTDED